MNLIGSSGRSQLINLGTGFSQGEERSIADIAVNDVGDLYAIELTNLNPSDGLRVKTIEFSYKGNPFLFGKNTMVRSSLIMNGAFPQI